MFRIPLWIKLLLALVLLVGIACFAIYIIAVAKNMTFVEFIQSWFNSAPQVTEPVVDEVIDTATSVIM